MVDKIKQVDPGKLTAYERWELPNIGEPKVELQEQTEPKPEKLKLPTAEDIEKIRQQAYESGFEEGKKTGFEQGHSEGLSAGKEEGLKQGLEEGLAQGLEEGQQQINRTLSQLESMLSELVAPVEQQQALVEEAMLNVSMAVARTVIHRELSLDASSIAKAITAIINNLPKVDAGFSLLINPEDEIHIKPILEKYRAAIELKLDPSITQGGCFLSSSSQLIDYTIEKRFQKTVQAMLSEALKGANDDAAIEVPSNINALSDYPSQTLSDPIETQDSLECEPLEHEQVEHQNSDMDTPTPEASDE